MLLPLTHSRRIATVCKSDVTCDVHGTVTENELQNLLDDKEAQSTKKATKFALSMLTKCFNEKKMNQPHDKDTLAEVLKMFYIEA